MLVTLRATAPPASRRLLEPSRPRPGPRAGPAAARRGVREHGEPPPRRRAPDGRGGARGLAPLARARRRRRRRRRRRAPCGCPPRGPAQAPAGAGPARRRGRRGGRARRRASAARPPRRGRRGAAARRRGAGRRRRARHDPRRRPRRLGRRQPRAAPHLPERRLPMGVLRPLAQRLGRLVLDDGLRHASQGARLPPAPRRQRGGGWMTGLATALVLVGARIRHRPARGILAAFGVALALAASCLTLGLGTLAGDLELRRSIRALPAGERSLTVALPADTYDL